MKKNFFGIAIVLMFFLLLSCGILDEEWGSGFPCYFCEDSYLGYSSSSGYSGSYGSLSYGGQTYKTVVIGTQTWMAENLNYNVTGSVCYDNGSSNCTKYGRLYNWATAMNLPINCNSSNSTTCQVSSKHRGICPSGWHIPTNAEWATLVNYIETIDGKGSSTAVRYLKATSGWNSNGNGTDAYGFTALPGGRGFSGGSFSNVGNVGIWWSAFEIGASYAYGRCMYYYDERVSTVSYDKSHLFNIRCVKD